MEKRGTTLIWEAMAKKPVEMGLAVVEKAEIPEGQVDLVEPN